jgi:peptidoglycan hydrolase CwlO-like protein
MPLPGAPKPGAVSQDHRIVLDDVLATKRIYLGESTPSASASSNTTSDEAFRQTQVGSVTACTSLLVRAVHAQDERAYSLFKSELKRYEDVQLKRLHVVLDTNQREIQETKSIQTRMRGEIDQVKAEIESLALQLVQARESRPRREELEKLAQDTNAVPTVQALQASLESARADVDSINASIRKTNARVEMRKKQFKLVIQDIHELEQDLVDESSARSG